MAINFNVNPYYDDYDEDKGFHRILFKPSVSVQARELTQLQTILQKQVERMGKHFFEDGAMVIPGQIAIDTRVKSVKLTSASVGTRNIANDFASGTLTVTGATTGVEAIVLLGVPAEGSDPPTLLVRFTKTGTDNVTREFAASETVSTTIGGQPVTFTTAVTSPIANSSMAFIDAGVFFVQNTFVKVLPQRIVLDKYTNRPYYRIGLTVSESIVTSVDDASLNDNALGSPNESAPGADRYKITLTLSKLRFASSLDQDFVELAEVIDGIPTKIVSRTKYSTLEKTLARRTFEESGNYTVKPFRINLREYRNNFRGEWTTGANVLVGDVATYNGNTYVATTEGKTGGTAPTHTFGEATSGVTWLYTQFPKYNSGLYTPRNTTTLESEQADETKIVAGIEPGKAYIQGYEVEKIAVDYVAIPKSRDYSTTTSDLIDTTIGNYVVVSNVFISTTAVNVESSVSVDLYNQFGGGTKVGAARIRAIYYDSGNASLTNSTFKLSLFDIEMNTGKSFSRDVKHFYNTGFSANVQGYNSDYLLLSGTGNAAASTTIIGSGSLFSEELVVGDYIYFDSPVEGLRRVTAVNSDYSITVDSAATITNSRLYRVETQLKNTQYTPAIFLLPYSGIKSVTPTTLITANSFVGTASAGSLTLTLGTGTFPAGTSSDLVSIFNVDASVRRPVKGTFTTLTADSSTLTITGLPTGSHQYMVVAPHKQVLAGPDYQKKTKTPTFVSKLVTNSQIYAAREIPLDKTDAFEIVSVTQESIAGNVEISEWFVLDNGQRSTHYDVSKLIRKANYPAPSGNLQIGFRHYAHSSGIYFSKDSYTSTPYEKIPVFYGDNYTVRLADVIDFRPVKNDNGVGYKTQFLPYNNFESRFSYDQYLTRKDKICIELSGNIFNLQGASAIQSQEPNDPSVGMPLFRINMQPYTMSTKEPDIKVDVIDNKRFTMRDISNLEKRIENIEYYTALSLLEQDTVSLSIRDAYGLERFKNGFVVDNFEGHGVGDVFAPDYRCSVDMENNELRPQYTMDNVNLVEKFTSSAERDSAAYQKTGDLITLKYNETLLINQSFASRTENINPFALATFLGSISLTPSSDEWFETEVRPDVVVNEEGNFDAVVTKLESEGALNTVWNAWQTQWTGTTLSSVNRLDSQLSTALGAEFDSKFGITNAGAQVDGTVRQVNLQVDTLNIGQARTGVRTSVISRIDRRVLDERVISTATIPFIRSRVIRFVGRQFKPNTKLYPFFDNVNMSTFATPATRLSYTAVAGTFNGGINYDTYDGENERAARRVNGVPEPAFNRGDIVYEGTTVTTANATAVVAFVDDVSTPKVLHLINVKGIFVQGRTITAYPTTSTTGTILANATVETTGNSLITNQYGDIVGTFTIPNTPALRFRTGNREFRLSDDISNIEGNSTTSGSVVYSATGVLQTRQATIASTRNAEVVRNQVTESRTITESIEKVVSDTGWYKPAPPPAVVPPKAGTVHSAPSFSGDYYNTDSPGTGPGDTGPGPGGPDSGGGTGSAPSDSSGAGGQGDTGAATSGW